MIMDANASDAIKILIGTAVVARKNAQAADQSWLNLLECAREAIVGVNDEVEEMRRVAGEEKERLQAEIKQLKIERADHLRKKLKEIET
jgi:hypothetical protein